MGPHPRDALFAAAWRVLVECVRLGSHRGAAIAWVLALAFTSALVLTAEAEAEPSRACGLSAPDSGHATTASCEACHPQGRTHPVDVEYRDAASRNRRLADAETVLRAGVRLPQGQIRCVTCHDRASPWRYQIALPPGATPEPSVAVMRARPAEYPDLKPHAGAKLPPGSEVTPTPLCRACHLF